MRTLTSYGQPRGDSTDQVCRKGIWVPVIKYRRQSLIRAQYDTYFLKEERYRGQPMAFIAKS